MSLHTKNTEALRDSRRSVCLGCIILRQYAFMITYGSHRFAINSRQLPTVSAFHLEGDLSLRTYRKVAQAKMYPIADIQMRYYTTIMVAVKHCSYLSATVPFIAASTSHCFSAGPKARWKINDHQIDWKD